MVQSGYLYIFYISSCWDIVEICWLEDFSSFLLIIQMDVTRLADLESKVVSSFHILWLRADHFQAATENWSNSYYFHAISIYQHNNIVELASLAQLYTLHHHWLPSQVLCMQWPGPSSKNSAQTWQIPKKPDDQGTSHLSNILLLQPSLNLPFITQKAVPFSHPKTWHRPDVRVPLPRYLWRVPWQRPRPGRKGPGLGPSRELTYPTWRKGKSLTQKFL